MIGDGLYPSHSARQLLVMSPPRLSGVCLRGRLMSIEQQATKILLKRAAEVILELAAENVLSEEAANEDPEVLVPQREEQIAALDIMRDFLKIVLE